MTQFDAARPRADAGAKIMNASHVDPSRFVNAATALLSGPLDPDTIFAICAQQVRDVDAQIKDVLVRQQSRKGQSEVLGALSTAISHHHEIKHNKDAAKAEINGAFDRAIRQFGEGSEMGAKLTE